jgi:histidine ammonia-lyase
VIETQLVTGQDLDVDHVWAVALEGASASLSEGARERVRAGRRVVEAAAADPARTYGVNTGFGRLVTKTIPRELADELQVRLLRSHACGVGEPYPEEIVRAALLLRANALATGSSGTRF